MSHFVSVRDGMSNATEADLSNIAVAFISSGGGVVTNTDYLVQAQASPDNTVKVGTGRAYVPKADSTMVYSTLLDATQNVTIAANATGSTQIDSIVLYIDLSVSPDANASNVAKFADVRGSGGVAPTNAQILTAIGASNPYIILANISVANGFTSISSGNITDKRSVVKLGSTSFATLNPPEGVLQNGEISASVASSNLTVAIKTLAGNDPSTSDPVYVRIGNTVRTLTAALSVTLNAGTSWFNAGGTELTGQEIDYFVYLCWKASSSALVIGIARIPWGVTYADFSSTTTNELYFAPSSTPASTDQVEVVGRFNATLTGTNWSIPATPVVVNRPVFETRWLTWAPQWGDGSMTFGTVTIEIMRYKVDYKRMVFFASAGGTTGGTPTASIGMTVPFTLLNTTTVAQSFGSFITSDGAGSVAGMVILGTGGGNKLFGRKYDGSNYSAGAGRNFQANGSALLKNEL